MQLKAHTGHKSDSAAQGYVDLVQKQLASAAVSVESMTTLKRSSTTTIDVDDRTPSVSFNFTGARRIVSSVQSHVDPTAAEIFHLD